MTFYKRDPGEVGHQFWEEKDGATFSATRQTIASKNAGAARSQSFVGGALHRASLFAQLALRGANSLRATSGVSTYNGTQTSTWR